MIFMRSILYIIFLDFVLVSCKNSYTNNTTNVTIPDTVVIEEEYHELSPQVDSVDIDSTAISNIKFCISHDEFYNRKKTFLNSHPNLGNLKIASINGFFTMTV